MVKYVIKRLLLSILILAGVSMIIYGLVRVMPVDYLESKLAASLGSGGSDIEYEARLAEMKAYYGLDDESFVGICKGYWDWLVRFCQGDFGSSWKYGQPVETVISQNMGVSFAISFVSLILQLIIAIPLGIKWAIGQADVMALPLGTVIEFLQKGEANIFEKMFQRT